jgi:hypothetical protein
MYISPGLLLQALLGANYWIPSPNILITNTFRKWKEFPHDALPNQKFQEFAGMIIFVETLLNLGVKKGHPFR